MPTNPIHPHTSDRIAQRAARSARHAPDEFGTTEVWVVPYSGRPVFTAFKGGGRRFSIREDGFCEVEKKTEM
jgi:hypothetical protein